MAAANGHEQDIASRDRCPSEHGQRLLPLGRILVHLFSVGRPDDATIAAKRLDYIPSKEYNRFVWNVEHTDEFAAWWTEIEDAQKEDVTASVLLLMEHGPALPFPHSSGLEGSRHGQMRELRVQSKGRPIRVFYAFDPRRAAILLIGGDKTGDKRFYDRMIPIADKLYDDYLDELKKERLIP